MRALVKRHLLQPLEFGVESMSFGSSPAAGGTKASEDELLFLDQRILDALFALEGEPSRVQELPVQKNSCSEGSISAHLVPALGFANQSASSDAASYIPMHKTAPLHLPPSAFAAAHPQQDQALMSSSENLFARADATPAPSGGALPKRTGVSTTTTTTTPRRAPPPTPPPAPPATQNSQEPSSKHLDGLLMEGESDEEDQDSREREHRGRDGCDGNEAKRIRTDDHSPASLVPPTPGQRRGSGSVSASGAPRVRRRMDDNVHVQLSSHQVISLTAAQLDLKQQGYLGAIATSLHSKLSDEDKAILLNEQKRFRMRTSSRRRRDQRAAKEQALRAEIERAQTELNRVMSLIERCSARHLDPAQLTLFLAAARAALAQRYGFPQGP
jgi:hypothetical protein